MPHFLFDTPRLQVRRLEDADLGALLAVYGDAAAMRWVGDGRPLDHAPVSYTHLTLPTKA